MPIHKLTPLGLLLLSGCLYHATERTDDAIRELAAHPFDPAPTFLPEPASQLNESKAALPSTPNFDIQTTALLRAGQDAKADNDAKPAKDPPIDKEPDVKAEPLKKVPERAPIPNAIPGAETPLIKLPENKPEQPAYIHQLYPKMPPLPQEAKALPGPEGHPYTLADLQQIAATNSPTLRQAAADVEAARGNLIQAQTYPNPTLALGFTPSNNGSTPGAEIITLDQKVSTVGKIKLASAAAQKALDNAELALRRARSDLSTQVRNAYFAFLVNLETVRVSKALAVFTDEMYRIQEDVTEHGFGAVYEPAALRAQAFTTRLALQQAIANYIYSWKSLVAVVGLPQLPLSEVSGRVDRIIPYYDYDAVLAYALRNHTDVLTARNTVEQARYNLKLAQVTPIPDFDFNVGLQKDFALAPFGVMPTMTVSIPLPVWDKNKGNITAAEAALVRASEEPHHVAVAITNNLATAYANYKNNLSGLEYYRKFILPDQVRTFRGVYERRRVDILGVPGLASPPAFADLVTAEQTLVSNVQTYLGILGTLWSSVTSVADFLQTDDLFQLSQPLGVPALPDLEQLPCWMCNHPAAPQADGKPSVCLPQE
jgi:cobalt-zinc-cadmium efflux system outer membrane protein